MEYALLIYVDENAPTTPEQDRQTSQAYIAYTQMLLEHGVMRGGSALQSSSTATVVRQPAGGAERLVTDGPFAETKEQLGGFYIIDCPDLDKALEYARQLPIYAGQAVEVRPVRPTPDAAAAQAG